jgi:hypothetical protein
MENRKQFMDTAIMQRLIRSMQETSLETTCLANMINFTQDTDFGEDLIRINGVDTLVDSLKENYLEV